MSGGSEWRTVARIGVPLAYRQMLAGIIVVFVLSIGELNASVMLTTPTNNTAGPAIFAEWNRGNYPGVAALSLTLCGINSIAMLGLVAVGRKARQVH